MCDQKLEERFCLLYDLRQGKTASESHRCLVAAFGKDALSERQCHRWFERFRNGDESLTDEEHGKRPEVINNDELKAAIESDPRQTTLAKMFNVDQSTVVRHLHVIGKKNRCGKWVPHQLTDENLGARATISQFLFLRSKTPDLAPSDYHLFRSMQHSLAEKKFKNIDEVKIWTSEYFESQNSQESSRRASILCVQDGKRSLIMMVNMF